MTRKTTRIEPTFSGKPTQTNEQAYTHTSSAPRSSQKETEISLQEKILLSINQFVNSFLSYCQKEFLENKKRAILFTSITISIVIVILLISAITSSKQPEISNIEPIQKQSIDLSQRSHIVSFPDDFSLMATDYNGLVISWQADTIENDQLWDIRTTNGEKSCQEITFNNGDKYRTVSVTVENQQEYFAHFSPLDTAQLVKAIALRGNFNLCNYQFSLKGSQAVLGKHFYYSELLSY